MRAAAAPGAKSAEVVEVLESPVKVEPGDTGGTQEASKGARV